MKVEVEVDTVLFDMDGTLIDSTPALNATWVEFAKEFNLDINYVLHHSHGHRTVENLKRYIPSLEGDALMKEVVRFESRILEIAQANLERAKQTGIAEGTIIAMPGARQLLEQIQQGRNANPSRRAGWAIVTSATSAYAQKAFAASDVSTPPDTFITSDECSHGKPDPEPYAKGAELCGADVSKCVVVEDAPPGVLSGKRAGARVLGLRTTHAGSRMWEQGSDWVVPDLSYVQAEWRNGDRLFLVIDTEEKPTMTRS